MRVGSREIQPSVPMTKIRVQVFPETRFAIEKLAKDRGESVETTAGYLLEQAAQKFPLSAEDFRALAKSAPKKVRRKSDPAMNLTKFRKTIGAMSSDELDQVGGRLDAYRRAVAVKKAEVLGATAQGTRCKSGARRGTKALAV